MSNTLVLAQLSFDGTLRLLSGRWDLLLSCTEQEAQAGADPHQPGLGLGEDLQKALGPGSGVEASSLLQGAAESDQLSLSAAHPPAS